MFLCFHLASTALWTLNFPFAMIRNDMSRVVKFFDVRDVKALKDLISQHRREIFNELAVNFIEKLLYKFLRSFSNKI